jgi:hypothetical protein
MKPAFVRCRQRGLAHKSASAATLQGRLRLRIEVAPSGKVIGARAPPWANRVTTTLDAAKRTCRRSALDSAQVGRSHADVVYVSQLAEHAHHIERARSLRGSIAATAWSPLVGDPSRAAQLKQVLAQFCL